MLAINRESILFDPISWGEFRSRLLEWAENHCSALKINEVTEHLFLERAPLSHSGRKASSSTQRPCSIYNFFDPVQDFRTEANLLHAQGIPLNIASKISKINNHNKQLCMLGILPNQLRELLKLQNPTQYDAAFEEFSRELFWSGYKIWRTRKEKMKTFWKHIAPEWWKVHHKEKKHPRKQHENKIAEQCSHPFHFLRRIINLSGQRRTICTCSEVQRPISMYKFRDISIFGIDHDRGNDTKND